MKMMAFAALASLCASAAYGQNCQYRTSLPTIADQGLSIPQCDTNGKLLISGSFSGTVSPYAPGNTYASLAVSNVTSNVALPAGATVVIYNTGTVGAYVKLGAVGVTAATTNDYVPANSVIAFTVGANTFLAGITASGTTTLNISGGSGVFSGFGGGSQAGGGGTSSTFAAAFPGTGTAIGVKNGANMVNLTADASSNLNVAVNAALPAGTALLGKVGIDQTTPGTTNAVALTASEAHAGEVGANGYSLTNTMTTTASNTYTTGRSIGGKQTITNAARVSGAIGASGTSGTITNVAVAINAPTGVGTLIDVVYFNADPAASTCTDNTALLVSDTDRGKIVGIVHLGDINDLRNATGDVVAQSSPGLALQYEISSGTSIYACVVSRDSTWATTTGTSNASLLTHMARN